VCLAHLAQLASIASHTIAGEHARTAQLRDGLCQLDATCDALSFWRGQDRALDERCRVTCERDVDIACVGCGRLDQIGRERRDGRFQPLREQRLVETGRKRGVTGYL
jgi:hypothetical protein